MLKRRFMLVLLSALFLFGSAFAAAELAAGVSKVTSVEGIDEYRLANGLHVALATLVWSGVLTCAMLTLPRTVRRAELSHLAVEKSSA